MDKIGWTAVILIALLLASGVGLSIAGQSGDALIGAAITLALIAGGAKVVQKVKG